MKIEQKIIKFNYTKKNGDTKNYEIEKCGYDDKYLYGLDLKDNRQYKKFILKNINLVITEIIKNKLLI